MRDVLNEMQSDPSAAAKHMANPEVAKKIGEMWKKLPEVGTASLPRSTLCY